MGISLKKEHLKLYGEIARLLFKYGRHDLVKQAGLEEALETSAPAGADPLPDELAADLERLGPTFIKLGQLLSTRADLMPAAYLQSLAKLQDDIEAMPLPVIEEIIEKELGVRISKAFLEFDAEPVAAASLGQVHRAVMRGGRVVAVKVQRPEVRAIITSDLEALHEIAIFLDAHTDAGRRFDFSGILDNARASLMRELDYQTEAANLSELGRNLADFPLLMVPKPIDDFTTSRVLTMEFVEGRKITSIGHLKRMELDGTALADQLFRAYLKQVLVDGFFHADPHPGNVLLTDDDRLALVDLGMVSRLTARTQEALLRLIVSIGDANGDQAAEAAFALGEALPSFDKEACRREIARIVGWSKGVTVERMQVGNIVLDVTRLCTQHGLRLPVELTMLGKALLNLDRIGVILDPDFDPNAAIRRHSAEVASRRMAKSFSPSTFLSSLVDMQEFLRELPGRANKILDAVANNHIKVTVDAIDEDRLISGIQKVANRITLGLVLAALIVGAALIMRVPTSFTIFGYPGLAIILFLLAAGGAVALSVHILISDGKRSVGKRPPKPGA